LDGAGADDALDVLDEADLDHSPRSATTRPPARPRIPLRRRRRSARSAGRRPVGSPDSDLSIFGDEDDEI